MIRAACVLAALFGPASLASAQECCLALVLALDVSASMNSEDDWLQRQGLTGALLAPEVVQAFLAGDPMALYVFQWSCRAQPPSGSSPTASRELLRELNLPLVGGWPLGVDAG